MHFSYSGDGKLLCLSNEIAKVEYQYSSDRLDVGYSIELTNGRTFTRNIVRNTYRRGLFMNISSVMNESQLDYYSYSYDVLNRPISRNSDIFGYNDRSEVVDAFILGNAAKYGYDEIGNSTNWIANSLNQYNHLQYDLDGNLLTDGNLVFTCDSYKRLKTLSSNGVLLVTNFYDAKSRRVKKVTQNATTTFFYDDWNLIEERIAYANGTTSTIHYYWGKDLSGTLQGAGGVGGLLYQTVDGAIYIPCYDNNGNVTKYIDSNGNIAASYTYDAFGNLISKSGSLADFFRHRFSTKYFDTESNLYYYGYRFYHPILMRWLNRDPIEENGGMNLYGFCGNTNIGYDRLGLYVNIVYDVKEKTLSATDVDTRESITLKGKVISGNGKSCCVKEDQWRVGEGPLPVGRYLVGLSYIPNAHLNDSGDYDWYKLYGNNGKNGYSYNKIPVTAPDGTRVYRGGFNLHTGRASDGCVTVWSDVSRGDSEYPKSEDYNKLKSLLNKTKPLIYKGSGYTGWMEVK
jgi:RHS repeat-associated protein